MQNDRILLITYDFPPALSGVRRIVKFAKFLPEFGFDPIVLCAPPDGRSTLDFETLREVEEQGYPVFQVAGADPYQLIQRARKFAGRAQDERGSSAREATTPQHEPRRKRSPVGSLLSPAARGLMRFAFIPDERVGWVPFARRAAERAIRDQSIGYVLTTSYPHSTHLVGLALKKGHPELKWVADFRDGWVQNPYFGKGPTPAHTKLNQRLEHAVARKADALVTVSEPIAEHLRQAAGNIEKVRVIPNGFDPDDFSGIERTTFDRFTIAYTGTLFMQRSPRSFFQALRMLLDERPELADQIQILFMTRFKPEHVEAIERLGLQDVVKNRGLGAYCEALSLQASADALLVMEGEAPNAHIMLTQKIFEYLAAGKPILAVAPEGALASLVEKSGAGIVVRPDDVSGIKESIEKLVGGRFPFAPDVELINSFHRRNLTHSLAKVLGGID